MKHSAALGQENQITSPTEGRPVTYDIVGCGSVVELIHLPVLRVLRERDVVRVAGCFDPDVKRAEALAESLGAKFWGEAPNPASGDGVDAALIATPPSSHSELGLRYVEAGKGVFLEKPATATAGELDALLDRARTLGVHVAVNHFWRYHPALETARRFLRGRIAEVDTVVAMEGSRWAWPAASDYVIEDPFGGVIHDSGSHLLDSVIYLLGLDLVPPHSVSAVIDELSKEPAREPSHRCQANIVLGSEHGAVQITLGLSRLGPLPRGVRVRGSFGELYVPPGPASSVLLRRGGGTFRLASAGEALVPGDFGGCFQLGHEDFASAVVGCSGQSRIDADRFRLLMSVLEAMRDWGQS